MKKNPVLFLALLPLSACSVLVYGPFGETNARQAMEQSKSAYDACLTQHPQEVDFCGDAKRMYESDKEKYLEIRSGWT